MRSYHERLDGFHTRGNCCPLLHFAVLCASPRVVQWAARVKHADPDIVFKISCPAVIPAGTRLRLKMTYMGVREILQPSEGRYETIEARSASLLARRPVERCCVAVGV
jgi:hypothetical protein